MLRPVLAAAAVVALAAPVAADARTVTVRGSRNGDTVALQRGDRLRVELAENGSTGYRWQFAKRPLPAVLRFVRSTYVAPPESDPPVAGAGGTRVYVFRARGSGRTSLRLRYVGPGSSAPVARRFRLTVRVR